MPVRRLVTGFLLAALVAPLPADSQPRVATLTLDALSFLSFDDETVYSIPAGGIIRFHFGDADTKGSASFRIDPADVQIAPIAIGAEEEFRFALLEPSVGTLRVDDDGTASVVFDAKLRFGLEHDIQGGSRKLLVRFTTGSATARRPDGAKSLDVSGVRLDSRSRALQLVGTATGLDNDYPVPGAAIYVVLSGTFDALPSR